MEPIPTVLEWRPLNEVKQMGHFEAVKGLQCLKLRWKQMIFPPLLFSLGHFVSGQWGASLVLGSFLYHSTISVWSGLPLGAAGYTRTFNASQKTERVGGSIRYWG